MPDRDKPVPNLRDMSQGHNSTYLGAAVKNALDRNGDRIIAITDEQSHDLLPQIPKGTKAYMINVASNKNGIGYGDWIHIDGWSESILSYIIEYERSSMLHCGD